ncbi:MAG: glycosyltransferase [Candidatus Thorarchaeota archaeon]
MRIVHISAGKLPDPRIEKTALTMKKEGHELVFLGGKSTQSQSLDAFDEIHYYPHLDSTRLVLSPYHRKKWARKIESMRPDVVHAHDIKVANFLLETKLPAIYDDHEYWSKSIKFDYADDVQTKLFLRALGVKVRFWERQLVSRYPTLVTNQIVQRDHSRYGGWVGVTMNVPTRSQVEGLALNKPRNGVVYVGGDFNQLGFRPHRDMTGLKSHLNFDVVTGLTHREMMEVLSEYKVGLTPWLWHPFTTICTPNKSYEYLHAGLQVVISKHMAWHFENAPYVYPFEDYSVIHDVIENLPEENPEVISLYAKEHYIWEIQETVVQEAYRRALNI